MDQINKDIDALERKLGKAIKIASKGDKMTLGDAIKLGRKSSSIDSTLRTATKKYSTFDPNPQQAKHVYDRMVTIVKLSQDQLELMVQYKPQLEKLRVAGLVKKNIIKTEEAAMGLANMTVGKAPPEIKPDAEALAKKSQTSFTKALGAFQNATGGEEHEADGGDDSD